MRCSELRCAIGRAMRIPEREVRLHELGLGDTRAWKRGGLLVALVAVVVATHAYYRRPRATEVSQTRGGELALEAVAAAVCQLGALR